MADGVGLAQDVDQAISDEDVEGNMGSDTASTDLQDEVGDVLR